MKKFSLSNVKEQTTIMQTVLENPKTETITAVTVSDATTIPTTTEKPKETTTISTTVPTTIPKIQTGDYNEYSIYIDLTHTFPTN